MTLLLKQNFSTTFRRAWTLSTPTSNFGPNWATKILKVVLKIFHKVSFGYFISQKTKITIYTDQIAGKNRMFCQMLCNINFFNSFYILRVRQSPTLTDFCGYYSKDIFTVDVLSCVLFSWRYCQVAWSYVNHFLVGLYNSKTTGRGAPTL